MKPKTNCRKSLYSILMLTCLSGVTLPAFTQNITRISPQEAGNMRKGNPNKELAVTYTVAELREILDQSSDGLIQFQFAKDKGRFTLIIALNTGDTESENGASAKGPNSKMNDLTRKSLFAAAFFSGGRICPPPSNCLIE